MSNRIPSAARRAGQEAFTLVELLIVIVIIGVLSGVVVFAVGAFDNEGVAAACGADKKSVEVAVEAYKAKTGSYPAASTGGNASLTTGNYLRAYPTSTKYTITMNGTGGVTGTITAGGTC